MSSQSSGEDGEVCSDKATIGSSDPDPDELELVQTRSRSSERSSQGSMTMRLVQDLHAAPTEGRGLIGNRDPIDGGNTTDVRDPTTTTQGTTGADGNPFKGLGLTPPPLPSVMLPGKRRRLVEILDDEKAPEKDKLSVEIDRIAEAGSSESNALQAGPPGTQNDEPVHPHRRKKSKTSEQLPALRTMTDDIDPDQRGDRLPERRRSARIRDAAHQQPQNQ
ncbi:hypothetical protein F4861DRAFT_86275 [Xylaria intraflava]|nr:hypothetical protein F4861DRAFT_86275 [Xylaria intraflava]